MKKYLSLNLRDYFNADAISYDNDRSDGAFSLTTYPAEELPESNTIITFNQIPIKFPSKEAGDLNNIECDRQVISIPKNYYQSMYILAACDNGSFEETIELLYENRIVPANLSVSDWIASSPLFGEMTVLTCDHVHSPNRDILNLVVKIYLQSVKVDPQTPLIGVKLPDNPCVHLFAVTLERKVD